MNAKIVLLPGDGIGPEVVGEARRVLDAVAQLFGHEFEYSTHLLGGCAIDATGVKCWGNDKEGQVSKIPPLTNPTAIAVGRLHSCAIDDTGVKCWGNDEQGAVSKTPVIF